MRDMATIGACGAGPLAAHDLRQRGYNVTWFSDRMAEDFLGKAGPTGTTLRAGSK